MRKPYKDIWGGRHNEQKCDKCGGSGRNPDYRETRCQYHGGCYTTIVYSAKSSHPPTLCPHHKEVVARERQEANANRERNNRERQQHQQTQRTSSNSKWQEKRCPGFNGETCYNTIKYRTDWDHIPDLCPSCKEKAKAARSQKHSQPDNKRTLGAYDSLPGSGRTPNDLGCTHAKVSSPNRYGGEHVTVYNRNLEYHEHYSYDTDSSGNYVQGSAHTTDAMAEVLRAHGHTRT